MQLLDMGLSVDYRREIETLHEFFVEWYCGACDRDRFERLETALGSSFERVAPDGSVDERAVVLESVRNAYDTYAPGTFEIEIRNVEEVGTNDRPVLVRYEEWQTSPAGTNGRISTALFDSPLKEGHIEWQYLHETWLESPA